MKNVCLNHTQLQRIVYSQIQFNEKIWSNGRKFKLWKFESKITKFHYFNFLWHALPLSYSSFTRGQNRTGDLTTRRNTLYVFFCNKNIFAITTEINTLYSSKFELLLDISTITKASRIVPKQKIPSFAIIPTLPFCNYSFSQMLYDNTMFLKLGISTSTFVLSLLKWGQVFNCGLTVNRRMIIGHLFKSMCTVWGIATKFYI